MEAENNTETESLLEWRAFEYPFWEKHTSWYSSVLIIGSAVAISSFFLVNTIFAILVMISTVSLLLISSIPPKKIDVSITNRGVVMGRYFYSYKNLESFSISELDKPPRLYLKSKKTLAPLIITEINEVDIEEVRDVLKGHFDEEELFEPFFHRLFEYIGF